METESGKNHCKVQRPYTQASPVKKSPEANGAVSILLQQQNVGNKKCRHNEEEIQTNSCTIVELGEQSSGSNESVRAKNNQETEKPKAIQVWEVRQRLGVDRLLSLHRAQVGD
jgi:hypothetical protein